MHFSKLSLASGLLLVGNTLAIDLDLSDAESINSAAKTIAKSIVDRYHNGSTVTGIFGEPYYWWESGLAWDSLIHYWHQTGDDSYNELIGEALRWQLGSGNDYEPANQTKSLGNDDQATWALAAMSAAEYGFPSDALDGLDLTWAGIAETVFNRQALRWDEETCNGGLRWQIFPFNAGYDYKNTLTNGNFYQLAGRLARYTGNTTYADWGQEIIQWSFDTGLIGDINSTEPAAVYDGTDSSMNCSDLNHIQWTANIGTYLAGGAHMYNNTASINNRLHDSFVARLNITFANPANGSANGTLTEIACAPTDNCNTDQLAFRAILARALAQARSLTDSMGTPFTYPEGTNTTDILRNPPPASERIPAWTTHQKIDFIVQQSAKGAAAQCSGGKEGTTCGNDWASSTWDGSSGLGQDLSALNIILANVPIGYLATINDTASDAGGDRGTLDDANKTISDVGDVIDAGSDAAEDAASANSAGHFAVSSLGLLVAVGSMVLCL
ncbi:hypothetical protein Q7P37_009570 [Cladosporium fusiforme]